DRRRRDDPPSRRGPRADPSVKALALLIVLGSSLPGTSQGREPDTSGLGLRLSLETVVARTLAYSPGVAGAQGAVRDAAALRRVALGTYLPSLSLISSAGWSDQTLGGVGVTPGLNPSSAMN